MDVDILFSRPQDRDAVDVVLVSDCLAWAAGQLPGAVPDRSMSVLLADAIEISRLHSQFFGDSSVTDVVSFPSGEDPGQPGAYVGDVAICLEVATEQAREAGHSLLREVQFLALHGLLHLLGYDDQTAPERKHMLDLQASLLARFESEVRRF